MVASPALRVPAEQAAHGAPVALVAPRAIPAPAVCLSPDRPVTVAPVERVSAVNRSPSVLAAETAETAAPAVRSAVVVKAATAATDQTATAVPPAGTAETAAMAAMPAIPQSASAAMVVMVETAETAVAQHLPPAPAVPVVLEAVAQRPETTALMGNPNPPHMDAPPDGHGFGRLRKKEFRRGPPGGGCMRS